MPNSSESSVVNKNSWSNKVPSSNMRFRSGVFLSGMILGEKFMNRKKIPPNIYSKYFSDEILGNIKEKA